MLSLPDEISPAIHNQISKHKTRLRKRLRGVCEGLVSENTYALGRWVNTYNGTAPLALSSRKLFNSDLTNFYHK